MKKIGYIFLLGLMVLGIGMFQPQAAAEAKAATPEKVKFAKKAEPGRWSKNSTGYRYYYIYLKKYAKNVWLNVGGKVYYINKKCYRETGIVKYKGRKYFLNSKGVLSCGWKKIGNKKYFFSTKTGAAIRGWQTVSGTHYFFKENGVLRTNCWVGEYYVGSDGRMLKNTQVGEYYLGSDGRRVAVDDSISLNDHAPVIFLGDSRTVGMESIIGGEHAYIGKTGEGYRWLVDYAASMLDNYLKVQPESKVIINLGINDLGNIENYIAYYKDLMLRYPTTKFYMMSVNPVEEKAAAAGGYNTLYVNNGNIQAFNSRLSAEFPAIYIDSYNYLINQKYVRNTAAAYGTVDGIHYTSTVYQYIYDYAISNIS